MSFFDTYEPYEIANKITANNYLSSDLVSHVYCIMRKKKGIEDEAAFFARTAYQQWTFYNSEFNRLYRSDSEVEVNEEITERIEVENQETKFQKYLRDYLEEESEGECNTEWFKKQIARFRICGMTYREIQDRYKVSRYIAEMTMKQFTEDVYNDFIRSSGSEDIDNL